MNHAQPHRTEDSEWEEALHPPTEDELPCDDPNGEPVESYLHYVLPQVLFVSLNYAWSHRTDFFAAVNMFVYSVLSEAEVRPFRAPDFFAVVGVDPRPRKSWVCWQEGRVPDVVVEILSKSTAKVDRGEKFHHYETSLRAPNLFHYDPVSSTLRGWSQHNGRYEPIAPNDSGRFACVPLGLELGLLEGDYAAYQGPLLRWFDAAGQVLALPHERAAAEAQRAAVEAQRAAAEAQRAAAEAQRATAEAQRATAEAQRATAEAQRATAAEQRVLELEAELQRLRGA